MKQWQMEVLYANIWTAAAMCTKNYAGLAPAAMWVYFSYKSVKAGK